MRENEKQKAGNGEELEGLLGDASGDARLAKDVRQGR